MLKGTEGVFIVIPTMNDGFHSKIHRRTSLSFSVTLADEIFAVMLAGFEDEVLKLAWISIGRKFPQLFGGYLHGFPLICFFFRHNASDHICR